MGGRGGDGEQCYGDKHQFQHGLPPRTLIDEGRAVPVTAPRSVLALREGATTRGVVAPSITAPRSLTEGALLLVYQQPAPLSPVDRASESLDARSALGVQFFWLVCARGA